MEARLMGGNGELSIISPTVGPDLDIYSGLYSPLKNYGQYGFLTPELATNSLRNLVQGYTLPIKTLFTAEAEVFYTILILVLTADVGSIKDMQAVTDLDIKKVPLHNLTPLPYAVRKRNRGSDDGYAYDSVIVGNDRGDLDCAEGGCHFNELFICSNMNKWHAFHHADRATGWFRNTQVESWRPNNWKYIQTRNMNIDIILRFGDWGDSCEDRNTKQGDDLSWEKTITDWEYDEQNDHKYYESGYDISCMMVVTRSSVLYRARLFDEHLLCDVSFNRDGGFRFLMNAWDPSDRLVSLPSGAVQEVWIENSEYTPAPSLTELATIQKCKAGYIEFHTWDSTPEDLVINRCGLAAEFQCQIGDKTTTQCTNAAIFGRCTTWTDTNVFQECFAREVEECRSLKELRPAPRLFGGYNCVSISHKCKEELGDGLDLFFDMMDSQCKLCIGRSTELGIMFEDGYGCSGAYAGRHTCIQPVNSKRYMELISPTMETIKDREGYAKLLDYNVQCLECAPGNIPNDMILDDQSPCTSGWERIFTGDISQYQLVGHGTLLVACSRDACPAGEYRICSMTSCRKCECEGGDNGCGGFTPDGTRKDEYCLLNMTQCDGSGYENVGSTCTDLSSVACDVGQILDIVKYHNDESFSKPGLFHTTPGSQLDLKEKACSPCEHPGHPDRTDLLFCGGGSYWPGCNSTGITELPACIACDTASKSNNSSWKIRDIRSMIPDDFAECTWECDTDFYRDGDQCVSCTLNDCNSKEFRPTCFQGSVELPECQYCTQDMETGCEQGQHKLQCDGSAYENREGDILRVICVPCKTEETMDCGKEAPFEPCDKSYFEDTAGCVPCPGIDNKDVPNGISEYIGECEIVCNATWYRQENHIQGEMVRKCVLCETNPKSVCIGCNDLDDKTCNERYQLTKCGVVGMTSAPTCECKPGYGMAILNEVVSCVECTVFQVSLGGISKCSQCDAGYSGVSRTGSPECIACPINTFRPSFGTNRYENTKGCEPCASGTDGYTGATWCKICENGMMARIVEWSGYIWDYNATEWRSWQGIPPNKCGIDLSIDMCGPSGRSNIRLSTSREGTNEFGVESLEESYECDVCEGGLAYSANFDYSIAIPKD